METDCRLVCYCFGKTNVEIRAGAIRAGLKSVAEVSLHLLAGAGCALCRPDIESILASLSSGDPPAPPASVPGGPER